VVGCGQRRSAGGFFALATAALYAPMHNVAETREVKREMRVVLNADMGARVSRERARSRNVSPAATR
jgi:hypothetical protein